MAAPFPPQGNQTQQTEKPLKVYAEPYLEGQPLPIGVLTTGPGGVEVPPYALPGGVYLPVRVGDYVISNRYTGRLVEVISSEEFHERFGPSTD